MEDWTKAKVWALVTSHPSQRLKGCSCHQEFPNGHPMALQPGLDENVFGPQLPMYVSWNPKCPWHGVNGWNGTSAIDCWPTDEEWYSSWEKKRIESKDQTPKLNEFLEKCNA